MPFVLRILQREPGFTRPLGRFFEPERTDLRQFQYTRWVDGSTFLCLARRKVPGTMKAAPGCSTTR